MHRRVSFAIACTQMARVPPPIRCLPASVVAHKKNADKPGTQSAFICVHLWRIPLWFVVRHPVAVYCTTCSGRTAGI